MCFVTFYWDLCFQKTTTSSSCYGLALNMERFLPSRLEILGAFHIFSIDVSILESYVNSHLERLVGFFFQESIFSSLSCLFIVLHIFGAATQPPCSQWSHDSRLRQAPSVLLMEETNTSLSAHSPALRKSRTLDLWSTVFCFCFCPSNRLLNGIILFLWNPQGFWSISKLPSSLILSCFQVMRLCLAQSASKTSEIGSSPLDTPWIAGTLYICSNSLSPWEEAGSWRFCEANSILSQE